MKNRHMALLTAFSLLSYTLLNSCGRILTIDTTAVNSTAKNIALYDTGIKTIKLNNKTTEPYEYSLGDVDGNGYVDAVDASKVLSEYAHISSDMDSTFNEVQRKVADSNNDGFIDAVDASKILAFYAYISTDGTLTFEEYINNPPVSTTSAITTTTNVDKETTAQTTTQTTTQTILYSIYTGYTTVTKSSNPIPENPYITNCFYDGDSGKAYTSSQTLDFYDDNGIKSHTASIPDIIDLNSHVEMNLLYFDEGSWSITTEYHGHIYLWGYTTRTNEYYLYVDPEWLFI